MFRIGRDNIIINYDQSQHNEDSIICLVYGEVDCRCHIGKQINMGREEDEIISELVDKYMKTIQNNITIYKKIVVVGVIPACTRVECENVHGRITHEFPFVGTDAERVRYTEKMNRYIEEQCLLHGYIYFNPYQYYTREDGTLKFELSDQNVHLGDNTHFLNAFEKLYTEHAMI